MCGQGGGDLACSAHIFWAKESLFMFVYIVVAAIFDFTTAEDFGVEIAALSVGARAKERKRREGGEKKPIFSSLLEFQHSAFTSKHIRAPEEHALCCRQKRGTDFANTKLPMGNFHDTSKEHANPL